MNTRQTSIDCYNEIKTNGLLSKRRLEVYEAILKNAPCTSSEAMVGNLNYTNVLSQSRARFTELRELGVIYEKTERKCRVTKRNVIEWDLTDKLPKNIKFSNNTKKNRVNNALNALRELYKNKTTATDYDWVNVANLINSI
tara:strand:+ start:515 stop:937 length:423 start_codon:yes stop_codon:yes gene_type:complete